MLKFYEAYQQYNIPPALKDELFDRDGNNLEAIKNINKINIFIGPNNSGKSKIIRELLREKPALFYGEHNWQRIETPLRAFFDTVQTSLKTISAAEHFVINNSQNGAVINSDEIENKKLQYLVYTKNYNITEVIEHIRQQYISMPSGLNRTVAYNMRAQNSEAHFDAAKVESLFRVLEELSAAAVILIGKLQDLEIPETIKDAFSKVYIPSVRTLRPFGSRADIKKETLEEYNFPANIEIYNGQNLPGEISKLKNTGFESRQKINDFEELLSREFFESKKVTLTYEQDKKILLIKIGDEKERPIYELGDGLQMIIILTFPFFDNLRGIIVIEEPELFIHPGLQKTFIKFLLSHKVTDNFQVFLATHSNHIIDSINSSPEVSIFSVRKKEKAIDNGPEKIPDFVVENVAFGNSNVLNLLGITTSSVYLSNCTIWVEGITDKIYIQKFITSYLETLTPESDYFVCKKFREGTHYSFALTAGDSIVHWDFDETNEYDNDTDKIIVEKFCAKSLVIVDNDFGKGAERKNSFSKLLGDRFIVLDLPEIENYLPMSVINDTVMDYSSVLKAVKDDNMDVLAGSNLENHKIGYVIDQLLLKKYPGVKLFSAPGGTGSLRKGDKYDFCKKALAHISKNNLSHTSITLVEKILAFIVSNNS